MIIVAQATDIGALSAFRLPSLGGNFFISRYCSHARGGGRRAYLRDAPRLSCPTAFAQETPMRKAADEAVVSGG